MKQYILKPGKHQFAPGSPAIHQNDNLTDEEARWYLEKYPHIRSLFEILPNDGVDIHQPNTGTKRKRRTAKKVNIEVESQIAETSEYHN